MRIRHYTTQDSVASGRSDFSQEVSRRCLGLLQRAHPCIQLQGGPSTQEFDVANASIEAPSQRPDERGPSGIRIANYKIEIHCVCALCGLTFEAGGWASVCSLRHMLDACWQTDPRVHAFFIDGERRDGELWICEGAHRYRDAPLVIAFDRIANCCTALGAEAEDDSTSFVTGPDILSRPAADRD